MANVIGVVIGLMDIHNLVLVCMWDWFCLKRMKEIQVKTIDPAEDLLSLKSLAISISKLVSNEGE